MTNINNYLSEFKLLTDDIAIKDGFIINFGVKFNVTAHRFVNKQKVKLECINVIKKYFRVDKMQFGQPIHVSKLEYELMGVEGVRSINDVRIVQDINGNKLYRYSISMDGAIIQDSNGQSGYGFYYSFEHSHPTGNTPGVVLPAHPNNPAVFELKNPNENIEGVVL